MSSEVAEEAAATITPEEMATRIRTLAHDSMRGRDTPSPELEDAAVHIADRFRAMGLEPAGDDGTYIHRWDYDERGLEDVVLRVRDADGSSPRYEEDYFLLAETQGSSRAGTAVFAGQASTATMLPADARGGVIFYHVRGTELDLEFQRQLGAAIQPTMQAGASGLVLILDPEFPTHIVPDIAQGVAREQTPIPIVGITHDAGVRLLEQAGADPAEIRAAAADDGGGADPTVLDGTVEVEATPFSNRHRPPNVVAMAPGSDPTLRDSYVVVTAHFDHSGVGVPDETGDSIYNGADDNASGTAAMMEMAEAFAALPEAPRRSVLFLAVSGEEKGLLGSMAWVENPTVPVDDIVANVNLDMIARNSPDTIIGIGQEYSTLEDVLTSIQTEHPDLGLDVIRDPQPEERFFFRSDQLAFVQEMIPAVFFTGLDHEDYHRPSDEADKVDADKAARVARLAFHLAYRVAMDPQPPEWTEEGRRRVEEMLSSSPM
ncbi:MAG: M28 family peptidase [Gemmatimonadota bacterium]